MTTHDPALVETVAEAIGVADDYIWGLLTPDEQEPHFIRARAALDAITTSPRHALIELPEPTRVIPANEHEDGYTAWNSGKFKVSAYKGPPEVFIDSEPTPRSDLTGLAAALIAAVRAAESGSTTPENKE